MALVKNPRGRAMAAKTRRQAARLAADLEAELALNDSLPDGWEAEADAALADLRSRFGTLEEDDAYTAGPSSLSTRAKGNLNAPPESPEVRKEGERRRKAGSRAGSGGQGAPRSSRAGRRGRPARRSRTSSFMGRAARDTGIPAAGQSATTLILQTLGLMIGLALLFLVLRNAEQSGRGNSVIDLIGGGVTTFVAAVIRPVDPLAPRSSATGDASLGSPRDTSSAPASSKSPAEQVRSSRERLRQSSRSPLLPPSPLQLP